MMNQQHLNTSFSSFNSTINLCLLMTFFFSRQFFSSTSSDLLDLCSILMSVLTSWLFLIIMVTMNSANHSNMFLMTMNALQMVLLLVFQMWNLVWFFFMFESSMFLVLILVLTWGYQPERLKASIYMVFYTFFASIPLIMILFIIVKFTGSSFISLMKTDLSKFTPVITILSIVGFLVKIPMYGFHLWLPKAHVEAPVAGSMVLAGILLKLGGYGLLIFSQVNLAGDVLKFFYSWSLFGGGVIGVTILRLSDIKLMIAYSSVTHMAMVGSLALLGSEVGVWGLLWMMFGHGVTSSGMFASANMIYERTHSRSLMINKSVMSHSPSFATLWFILIVLNFSGPFTLNLFSEIMMSINIISISYGGFISVMLICFFSLVYNIILYSNIVQGSSNFFLSNISKISVRELLVSLSHIWPGFVGLALMQL